MQRDIAHVSVKVAQLIGLVRFFVGERFETKSPREIRERHSIDSGRIRPILMRESECLTLWERVTNNFSKFSRKSSKKILSSQRNKGRMLCPVSVTRRHIFLLNRAEFYRFICNLRIAYCRLSLKFSCITTTYIFSNETNEVLRTNFTSYTPADYSI